MSRGVYYIVTGESFVEEAHVSARSVRDMHPDLPIAIAADRDVDRSLFDHVIEIDDPAYSVEDKVRQAAETPFERTIFLDSDTYVCGEITELFELLDRFDIAGTVPGGIERHLRVEAPDSFPQLRTGVMVYEDNPRVHELFEIWNDVYDRHLRTVESPPNQPAMREAIYRSDVDLCVLGEEYNCAVMFPGVVHAEVKIIHGSPSNIEDVVDKMNAKTGTRLFTSISIGSERYMLIDLHEWPRRLIHFWLRLRKKGPVSVAKHASAWLRGQDGVE